MSEPVLTIPNALVDGDIGSSSSRERTIVAPPSTDHSGNGKPARSLKTKAIHGSAWTILGFGSAQMLRFASNLILTRFLDPEVFGLMALVLTFIAGVSLFSDFGIGAAIVQHKRGDDRTFLDTAWTIQVFRGIAIWLVLCALAYPAAHWYRHPQLLTFLPVCGLVAVISGLNSTALYSLNRHMAIGTLTQLQLLMQVVSMAVTIGWAAVSPTVWALIVGQLVGPLVFMLVSHRLSSGTSESPRKTNWFAWDSTAYQELFHFGKWIFVSTILFFLQSQVDRLVFDKVFHSLWLLGVYAIALQLAQLPTQVVGNLALSTLLPMFAQGAGFDGDRVFRQMGEKLLAIRRLMLPACLAAVLGIALGSPLFFRLLYKSEYHAAGRMAQWMVPGIWFGILQLSADRILQAAGRLRTLAFSNAVNLLFTIAGCFIGAKVWGLGGFIIGLGAGNLAGDIVIQISLASHGISLVRQDLGYTLLLAACIGGGLGLNRVLESVVHHPLLPALISTIVFVGGTGIWAASRALRGVR